MTAATPLLMGLDLGTSRLKVVLLATDGEIVATSAIPTPWRTAAAGQEMSPPEFLKTVGALVCTLDPMLRARVAGVGIASMGETGTLVRDDGTISTAMLAWHDSRGTDVVDRLRRAFGDEIRQRTGRPARPSSTVAKLGWQAAQGESVRGTWAGCAALVAYVLTGRLIQERSLAATSGAYHLEREQWDTDILAEAGLKAMRSPEVISARESVGVLHDLGASWMGIPQGVIVHLAGHDHMVGAIAVGAQQGDLVDSMGSGEPLLLVRPDATEGDPHAVTGGPPDVLDRITATLWPTAPVQALIWEDLLPGVGLETLAHALSTSRTVLEQQALACGPVEPLPRSWLRVWEEGGTTDLPLRPPGEIWARALEGYAHAAARAERVLRTYGARGAPTLLIGGGQRSRRWVDAKSRRATHGLTSSDDGEAVARGAAIIAGEGASLWTVEEAPRAPLVRLNDPEGPNLL